MEILPGRRAFALAAVGLLASPFVPAGMQPNEVPLQEDGIARAHRFLEALDQGADAQAYELLSRRARARIPAREFAVSVQDLRRRLGGRSIGRTLVGSAGKDPAVYQRQPNVSAQAQWTVRFRSKYPVGALFEDVHLEFDDSRTWAVAGWFFSPATF
jgi:hypothetical protein